MSTLRIVSVVGARPNFMKIAPLARAIEARNADASTPAIEHFLVHTGQHYDGNMSGAFFKALDIPEPDVDLGIGSGSHAEQVGATMIAFEKVVREQRPDWIVVVGDVNATCACSITAKKEHVRLAHIEAGLRSFDMTMPEEINRIVTDRLSDLLLSPDATADRNLLDEGRPEADIRRVGNIMIDTLEANRARAARLDVGEIVRRRLIGADSGQPDLAEGFAVMTLHRPSNVDSAQILSGLADYFTGELSEALPLVWTIHPRTGNRLREFGLWEEVAHCPRILLLEPVDYREMLKLNMEASLMLTDSGGLQEECCIFGTPCITLRENTERPVTLVENGGVNRLAGSDPDRIRTVLAEVSACTVSTAKTEHRPPLWDGHTAQRIVEELARF
jgi:UDP-N-acetylglucosamine 2-epimerase (non-hydrolysing)